MRDLFPGHYQPTSEDFGRIWTEGLFVFDTNVLLDIFRYSQETAEQLLSTLEKLKDRVWLPYQAATEYHRKLEKVINDQQKPYDDAIVQLRALLNSFRETRRHPFLESSLAEEATELFGRLQASLSASKGRIAGLLNANPTKERLAAIFGGRVGTAFSAEELAAIYEEGKKRYEAGTPPGFGDADKPEPERYGDLVLWMEVLRVARQKARPVVFVTGDVVKDDWFLRVGGRTIGPRSELVAEFKAHSDEPFYVYQTPSFLQYANEFLKAGVGSEAIEEVAELEARRRRRGGVPKPSREELLGAMAEFDRALRGTPDWSGWESHGRQKYAITHEGRLYPVKKVISLASGVPRGEFSGGTGANGYLRSQGFDVIQVSTGRRGWGTVDGDESDPDTRAR
jgi:predicted nucleic acid-binding protein